MIIVKSIINIGRASFTSIILIAMAPTLSHASADDVKCDVATQQLVQHYIKDFKKIFNKEISDTPKMHQHLQSLCEKGKADANEEFKKGKYNIMSAAMAVDFKSSMDQTVPDNYKPIIKQYESVAYMYGYVNWFVN
ncbi:TPA: hypothetical protein JLK53_004048 [Escherichia coli]|nr:hypothetical protein [Escherichia coli]